MSAYLIAEIERNDRIAVRTNAEIVDGGGQTGLEWLEIADRTSGRSDRIPVDGLFILIGTETCTGWLPVEIQRRPRVRAHRRRRRPCPMAAHPRTTEP